MHDVNPTPCCACVFSEAPKPAAPRVVVPKLPLKVVASDCAAADAVGELASAAVTATEDAPARAERLSDSANPVGTHRTQLAPVSHRSHEEVRPARWRTHLVFLRVSHS